MQNYFKKIKPISQKIVKVENTEDTKSLSDLSVIDDDLDLLIQEDLRDVFNKERH